MELPQSTDKSGLCWVLAIFSLGTSIYQLQIYVEGKKPKNQQAVPTVLRVEECRRQRIKRKHVKLKINNIT